jgi:hypothetical protein
MKSTTAARRGRHRTPSKIQRNIKVIGISLPALALLGGFVAYQASPPPHASGSPAAYHLGAALRDALADGPGIPDPGRSPSGEASSTGKAGIAAAAAGTSSQTATTGPAHRAISKAAASPSPGLHASQVATPAPPPLKNSPASLKAAVQADIASGNYLLAVGKYLVENGYSDAAAAGVASCIDGESGGNPESVGSGGGGLIGWTPISSAAPNPSIITGSPAQDMTAQLSDLLYYDSTEIGQPLVNQLDAISDPVAAADFFSQNFEKPAVTNSDVRPAAAQQIYSELRG